MARTIAILAPSSVPFQMGGAEKTWWAMREALASRGAIVDVIKIPSREDTFAELIASYEQFSKLDLSHFETLITTKYPAWIAPHPNHICYMMHPMRLMYDHYRFTGQPETLLNPPERLAPLLKLIRKPDPDRADLDAVFELARRALAIKSLPPSLFALPGPLIREIVHFFDRVALAKSQIKSHLAISRTVAGRKDYFPPGVRAKELYHATDLEGFHCREGEYFFTVSRLNSPKRIPLLIEAMKYVKGDIKLKIAGSGQDAAALRKLAAADSRISFLGHVSDEELIDLYAGAIAVPFAPMDEDFGMVTIEAMKSGKPVITTTDSGGVAELVRAGETGLVVAPEPEAIGGAMNDLASDRGKAEAMGSAARDFASQITWDNWAGKLLDIMDSDPEGAKRAIVLSHFEADASGPGGPRRLYHFCAGLARDFDVRIICVGEKTQNDVRERQLGRRIHQTSLPWSGAALAEADRLAESLNACADDAALMRHAASDGQLFAALRQYGANAACVILCHPWLYGAAEACLPDLPLVYEAQDVEADLKPTILGDAAICGEIADLEKRVCEKSALIFACSPGDRDRFADLYGQNKEKILVLPHGCDVSEPLADREKLSRRLPYKNSRIALFIASGHKPNKDAAFALFDIASKVKDVEFLIAGSVSTERDVWDAEKPKNVHLVGVVSERVKNILLARADLALNPVCGGSGVNLKSIEYLARGVPCISTPVGMRGLAVESGPACQIVDIERFPEAIGAFFANRPDANFMAESAARFSAQFAWENVLKPLAPAIKALAGE